MIISIKLTWLEFLGSTFAGNNALSVDWREMRYSSQVRAFTHGTMGHQIDPSSLTQLNYFLYQPVLHGWCNKYHGMYYPVCGMVHIKDTLLLTGKHRSCSGGSERERNVLFNDTLNTFYLLLYGIRHIVKDHSDSEKGNPLPPHRLILSINSKGSFICTMLWGVRRTNKCLCYGSQF